MKSTILKFGHCTVNHNLEREFYGNICDYFFVTLNLKIKDMDIQSSKIELVKIILNIENDKFIEKITKFIQKEKADFWDELSFAEQEEIEKGITELNNGKRVEFNDFLKKIS